MVSHFVKTAIFTTTLVLFSALEQRPLWAFSNIYPSVTSSNNADESTDASNTDEATESTNNYYSPNSVTEQSNPVSAAPVSTYTPAYTTTWANLSSSLPQRRKVPEPSVMLGLIAIATTLKIQRQMKKS
jgi:hypothetical protein